MSYPTLGKFEIPAVENWVPGVRYIPEPPVTTRASMNPWETERQRARYMAEETAWKAIVPLQTAYRKELAVFNRHFATYNSLVGQLDSVLGQSSGLIRGGGAIGKMVFSPVNMVHGLVSSILSKIPIVGGVFGGKKAKRKKRRAEQLLQQIEKEQVLLEKSQGLLVELDSQVTAQLQTAEAIRASQPGIMAADTERNRQQQADRASLERQRASVLQQRIKQDRIMRTPGGYSNEI